MEERPKSNSEGKQGTREIDPETGVRAAGSRKSGACEEEGDENGRPIRVVDGAGNSCRRANGGDEWGEREFDLPNRQRLAAICWQTDRTAEARLLRRRWRSRGGGGFGLGLGWRVFGSGAIGRNVGDPGDAGFGHVRAGR